MRNVPIIVATLTHDNARYAQMSRWCEERYGKARPLPWHCHADGGWAGCSGCFIFQHPAHAFEFKLRWG